MADLVRSERRGAVALLTLDRPKSLNALDAELLAALGEAVAGIGRDSRSDGRDGQEDPGARALVITGEGGRSLPAQTSRP